MNLSQIVISSRIKHAPNVFVFTEQGVAMLSGVLTSTRAVQVNVAIMRTFVKLREMLSTHKDLARKLSDMEKKYDSQFKVVFDAIRQLMTPVAPKKKNIGFQRRRNSAGAGAGNDHRCQCSGDFVSMIPTATVCFHKNHFPDIGNMVSINIPGTRHE